VSERRGISISVAATLLGLAACEVAARAVFPAPPDPTREPQIVYRADRQVRYVLSPNQKGWVDDGFVTTNSRGFRGREVDIPKPSGRLRIVALGDSVTFGWGVNDADTFCSQLEHDLRTQHPGVDLEVVNLGVPGYATRQEVALLKRSLRELQPDVVLVGFYTNDLPDTLDDQGAGRSGTRIEAAEDRGAGQILHMNPAPSSWLERQARRSRAVYTASHGLKALIHHGEGKPGSSMEVDLLEGRSSGDLEAAWTKVSAQLQDLQAAATEFHFSAGIVVLPPREQVFGLYPNSEYQKRIRSLADRLGLFVIDPLPSLVASSLRKPSLFIPYDRNHPSPAGHRLIAQSIATYLDGHRDVMHVATRLAQSQRAQ
jgi:lysophospholipase L1-like esterase